MLKLVLLIFVVLPIVELTLLFKLGHWLGWIPTLAVVFGAGIVGAAIARFEGLRATVRMRQQMAHGVLPAAEVFDGLLIAAAGVLLILPGILSDVLGLLLLMPPARKLARRWLMHVARTRFRVAMIHAGEPAGDDRRPLGDEIIDARVIETRVID
jgi:UPF0716 protein FxsA